MFSSRYTSVDVYERKLTKVMERLGIKDYYFNWDRWSAWVQFRYKGELYRVEHDVEKAQSHGHNLEYGSHAFAEIVMALEDIAGIVERGIYDLQTWVAGMRFLPPPIKTPEFFLFLGFQEIPSGPEEVKSRYSSLASQLHPDHGGSSEDYARLQEAAEQAINYFTNRKQKI